MNCLVVDENKRMCLEDILSHSWFDNESLTLTIEENSIENILDSEDL